MKIPSLAAPKPNSSRRLIPLLATFLATLVAAPGHAIDVPDVPLQTGAAYPAPNIMFILDDSGSMAWDFMPGAFRSSEVPATGPTLNVALRTSARNLLYYDPKLTYKPWIKADKTRYTGGTSFDAAYSHDSLTSDPVDLDSYNRTFYVLKEGADISKDASYVRYRFKPNGTVEKAEYSTGQSTNLDTRKGVSGDAGRYRWFGPFTINSSVDKLFVTSSSNSGNGNTALLVFREGFGYECVANDSNGNNESCHVLDPAPGEYYVGVYGYTGFSGITLTTEALTGYWTRNVANARPTGRTDSQERENYATWYSYHRTRMKAAKAGASEAFSQLGENLRVGYDSIWKRLGSTVQTGSGNPVAYPIPVGTENGAFKGTNRSTWFSHLHGAVGSNGTPLHVALDRSGQYFRNTDASGPWGPETGANQISCRQNFAILTTDGYWNSLPDTVPDYIGDADGQAGPTITNSKGDTFTYTPVKPYIDNFSTTPTSRPYTLADVAMHYWKTDLVSTLENNVAASPADPAFWQHMVTFGISIGLQGTLNPKTDLGSITNGSKRWPDPIDKEDAHRIDDLWHATVNGRGSFVAATNPNEFAEALLDALQTVGRRLGSASNVAANSTSFQTGTRVYQASYYSGTWTGELAAYDATKAGVASTPAWSASKLIPKKDRNVLTWAGNKGAAFPTSTQVDALARPDGLAPVTGADNAAYIRGDQSKEIKAGGTLRDRETVLGDIVNSSPIHVADNNTIFVGANDGMLHAFDDKTGVERFAYVPGGISLASLSTLSDPRYAHRYFVDGPVVVSTRKQTPGKNYLVGALGRGGKGLFGLDVTDPSTFAARDVLWEQPGGTNMGYVLGEPLIVKLNNGVNAVVTGNGINSAGGKAVLLVYNLATGALIKEFDTGVGGDNGMAAPRGWDEDGNGTVDFIYAGDLRGNLWKYDFSGSTVGSWKNAFGSSPMFVAERGGVRQPITAGLALARDPATGKRWVFVGTGRFIGNADVANTDVQSVYGLIDADSSISGRSALAERDIVATGKVSGKDARGFTAHGALTAGKRGWFVDLDTPTAGERVISNPRVRGTALIFASIIPPVSNSCEAGGTGYVNAIDAFTGTSLPNGYFDLDGDGNAKEHTIGDSKVPLGSVDLGVGMPTLPTIIDTLLVVGGSNGGLGSSPTVPTTTNRRRVAWRELLKD